MGKKKTRWGSEYALSIGFRVYVQASQFTSIEYTIDQWPRFGAVVVIA